MSHFDVDDDDMYLDLLDLVDDDTAEAVLTGRAEASSAPARIAIAMLRDVGAGPAPAPSQELAALFGDAAEGSSTHAGATVEQLAPRRRARLLRVAGGVGLATKLALGAGVAAAAVGGAGAAGVLPSPVEVVIRDVVHSVTPSDDGNDPAPLEPAPPSAPPGSQPAHLDSQTTAAPGTTATTEPVSPTTTTTSSAPAPAPSPNATDPSTNATDKSNNAGQPSPTATEQTPNAGGRAAGSSNVPDVPPGQAHGSNAGGGATGTDAAGANAADDAKSENTHRAGR